MLPFFGSILLAAPHIHAYGAYTIHRTSRFSLSKTKVGYVDSVCLPPSCPPLRAWCLTLSLFLSLHNMCILHLISLSIANIMYYV